MQVVVRSSDKRSETFDLAEGATVSDLVGRVEATFGFVAGSARIMLKGAMLSKGDVKLDSLGLSPSDFITCFGRPTSVAAAPSTSTTTTAAAAPPAAPTPAASAASTATAPPPAAPPAAAARAEVVISDEAVRTMVEMGIPEPDARMALAQADGDPALAVEMLMPGRADGGGSGSDDGGDGDGSEGSGGWADRGDGMDMGEVGLPPEAEAALRQRLAAMGAHLTPAQLRAVLADFMRREGGGGGAGGVGGGAAGGAGGGSGGGGGGGDDASHLLTRALAQAPGFEAFRAALVADIHLMSPLEGAMQVELPQLYTLIADNQELFIRLVQSGLPAGVPRAPPPATAPAADTVPALITLLRPAAAAAAAASSASSPPRPAGAGGGAAGGGDAGGHGHGHGHGRGTEVRLTPNEVAAVRRLQALGFDEQRALEAYLVCDKNEELAADFLFRESGM